MIADRRLDRLRMNVSSDQNARNPLYRQTSHTVYRTVADQRDWEREMLPIRLVCILRCFEIVENKQYIIFATYFFL